MMPLVMNLIVLVLVLVLVLVSIVIMMFFIRAIGNFQHPRGME